MGEKSVCAGCAVKELVFKGKELVWNHHLGVPFRPFVMLQDKGTGDPRLDGNLIAQGHIFRWLVDCGVTIFV